MDNEPYREFTHHEAADFIAAELQRLHWRCQREFTLPNGRVADVFARTDDADFVIVEVKTEFKASLVEAAWSKYAPWCNLLWLAVPDLIYGEHQPQLSITGWADHRDAVGVIGIYRQGIVGYRSPKQRAMQGDNYGCLRDLFNPL